MTFFFLYNPKQFIDPAWFDVPESDSLPKKRKIEQGISEKKELLNDIKDSETFTTELKTKISDFHETTEKISQISEKISEEMLEEAERSQILAEIKRIELFRLMIGEQILLMEEEEALMLTVLLLID